MRIMDLRSNPEFGFTHVVGIGGIGTGIMFQLEGNHSLGREESRLGKLLPARDFCKLHIVEHYIAAILGAKAGPFRVFAIGVIGEDSNGGQVLREMEEAGIDIQWVRRDAARNTLFSVCFLYPDGTGGNITASNSAAAALEKQDLDCGEELMRTTGKRCVALCLPEVPLTIRHRFLQLATDCGNFRVASFTRSEIAIAQALKLFSFVDLLALNQEEASDIVGYACSEENRSRFLADCAEALTSVQPAIQIVISAGSQGVYAFEEGTWRGYTAHRVPIASTAGAGDALLAGIVSGLAAGLPLTYAGDPLQTFSGSEIHSAVEFGLILASFSVTSPHTIHPEANLRSLDQFASSLAE